MVFLPYIFKRKITGVDRIIDDHDDLYIKMAETTSTMLCDIFCRHCELVAIVTQVEDDKGWHTFSLISNSVLKGWCKISTPLIEFILISDSSTWVNFLCRESTPTNDDFDLIILRVLLSNTNDEGKLYTIPFFEAIRVWNPCWQI